ncbi:MAG: hypothetical protein A3H98_04970 [Bacteroidetes bacterium RIFCSPLOWO2_02_FULL_36_8]|nr:MAG: hypothetical protein A3H98_04970 [Bacteroidetes bacterium RIFCSPLOWO2_02_FULL_36_8]OFY71826.1 MAG: hypothetical protein A3G23_14590 [Bacteroidetes bacterium RIFCSPLOWO2_12_FULL_37_12]
MLSRFYKYAIYFQIGLTLFACQSSTSQKIENTVTPVITKKIVNDTLKNDTTYSHISDFISGIKQKSVNDLSEYEKWSEWINYSREFDTNWAQLERERLIKMRTWRNVSIQEGQLKHKNIFYPFSGPDFLNAFTFFSDGENYYLIGLERVGSFPDVKKFKHSFLKNFFDEMIASLGDLFRKGYFITRKMDKYLNNQMDGTLPILSVFLTRTSHRIVNVNYLQIDSLGKISDFIPEDSTRNNPKKKRPRAIKIDFVACDTCQIKSLYYFSMDLSDAQLKNNKGILKFLSKNDSLTTYMKSASYLLHNRNFSFIRDFILTHSFRLLQDDSGIPYKYFSDTTWNIKLFGKYTEPIDDFKNYFEKDLSSAYTRDTTTRPLPFSLGYKWGTRGVNLLYAKKKNYQVHREK